MERPATRLWWLQHLPESAITEAGERNTKSLGAYFNEYFKQEQFRQSHYQVVWKLKVG